MHRQWFALTVVCNGKIYTSLIKQKQDAYLQANRTYTPRPSYPIYASDNLDSGWKEFDEIPYGSYDTGDYHTF
jgi:hypothetical protein